MSEIKEIEKTLTGKELMPQKRISPTSINTFYKCPRQYFYNYIAKLKIKPNIWLVKGGIVHKALEDFFRGYRKDLEGTIHKLFEKAWDKAYPRIRDLELPPNMVEQAKADCIGMVNEYFVTLQRKMNMLQISGKAQNEAHAFYLLKPKLRELWVEDKALHVGGFIDRVHKDFDGNTTIGDYKTSNKYGIGLPMDYKRQMALYSLLYTNQEKIMPHFVAVIFLRYGEEYLLEVTPSLLKFAQDTAVYVYERTRSTKIEDYPLKEGNLCRWCSFKDICSGKEDWSTALRQQKMKEIAKKSEKERKKVKGQKKLELGERNAT